MGSFKKFLKITVSALLLWLLFKRFDWASFCPIVKGIKGVWLIPVICLGPFGILLLAIRWRLFLVKLGIDLPLTKSARGVWTGAFFNVFLPGSTGGDFYRLIFVRVLFPESESKITSSLVLDRLFGVGALIFLGALGVIFEEHLFVHMLSEVGPIKTSTLFLVVSVGLVGLTFLFYVLIAAHEGSWLGKCRAFVWAMTLQIRTELTDPVLILRAFGLALGMHLLSFASGYFISKALGLNIGFIELALFTSGSALIMALPISINGFGVREVLLVGFFQFNGFSCGNGIGIKESAIAYSLIGVACDLIRVAPGGIWFALAKEAKTASTEKKR